MKIETSKQLHYGQTRLFARGIKLTFDEKGIAEVSEDIGEFLIQTYPDLLYPAGQVPKAPVERVRKSESSIPTKTETIEALQEKLQSANQLLNDFKIQLTKARDAERIWRMKCEELLKEVETKQRKIDALLETSEKSQKKSVDKKLQEDVKIDYKGNEDDATSLKKTLEYKTRAELISIAKELKLPESEYKELSKAKLVDYLLLKVASNNAQS